MDICKFMYMYEEAVVHCSESSSYKSDIFNSLIYLVSRVTSKFRHLCGTLYVCRIVKNNTRICI